MSNFLIEGPGGLPQIKVQGGYKSQLPISTTGIITAGGFTAASAGNAPSFNAGVAPVAGGAANSGLTIGSLGVGLYTGTGAPTFSAMNGSIYVDSSATTTTTRIYVNKSGAGTAGTTWTSLTTAA